MNPANATNAQSVTDKVSLLEARIAVLEREMKATKMHVHTIKAQYTPMGLDALALSLKNPESAAYKVLVHFNSGGSGPSLEVTDPPTVMGRPLQ